MFRYILWRSHLPFEIDGLRARHVVSLFELGSDRPFLSKESVKKLKLYDAYPSFRYKTLKTKNQKIMGHEKMRQRKIESCKRCFWHTVHEISNMKPIPNSVIDFIFTQVDERLCHNLSWIPFYSALRPLIRCNSENLGSASFSLVELRTITSDIDLLSVTVTRAEDSSIALLFKTYRMNC